MRWRLLPLLLAISLGGLAGGVAGGEVAGAEQDTATSGAAVCAGDPVLDVGSEPPDWLAAEAPAAELTLLAEVVVDRLPDGRSLLHVSHIALAPDWSGPTRSATGPVLLMTRTGTVTLFIDGSPTIVAAGESASVQSGQLYAVANETGEPATALRLSVLPPGEDGARVAEFMPSADNPELAPNPQAGYTPAPTNGPATISPVVSPLVQATLAAVPAPPARLFLACLAWAQAGDGGALHQHPGPVGVWIERGALAIGEERTLPRQGCTVFVAGETHQTAAAEPATAALLFGLLPEAESLWQPAAAASAIDPLDDVTCGDAPPE